MKGNTKKKLEKSCSEETEDTVQQSKTFNFSYNQTII